MPRQLYMDQRVFNLGVATAVRAHLLTGRPVEEFVAQLHRDYKESLVDDGFGREMLKSAHKLVELMAQREGILKECPDNLYLQWMRYFFADFQFDGRRRPFRLLRGLVFTAPRQPVADREAGFFKWYLIFNYHAMLRQIPLPPKGWRL